MPAALAATAVAWAKIHFAKKRIIPCKLRLPAALLPRATPNFVANMRETARH
jgi:hypothetical protein